MLFLVRSGLGGLFLGRGVGLGVSGFRVGVSAVRLQGLQFDHVAGGVGDLGVLDQVGQRLAADDLGDQARYQVVLDGVLGELVRADAGALRVPDDVLGEPPGR